ncbi:polysaccharide deacetylase [Cryobacterium sp. LW097]|uniref:polysaccharide deacetylase family protein n=1 Tax=unclassified Cryobacterium TaxID=2649013 RepID=UPI000B4D4CA2|nr:MULTISPECIES: polysaccharide deacetylase family protein [unclassified Cryobacterium]ASD20769.1 polysaccharide deacetylase [Cryobacterium sp. LW097]TFC50541.1 polysaccharide deacetylase family protein [Cryobacterium sp. TMB3-1-2]TFC58411.1 polysaccharide deacetylase family protein [Cryobacterium sp. TMB1-7]TFC74155.1 polysaccharide deacetylase family protein [Cryobacterium sp. TMB3-10]TFC74759.1 polysaccharide deacetylase family protein [Cryobacterium sp. TMB3-15]
MRQDPALTRRTVLASLGLSLTLAGCATLAAAPRPSVPATTTPPTPSPLPRPLPGAVPPPVPVAQPAPGLVRVPVPPGTLSDLPGEGTLLAWTVDDGSSSEVLARYIRFAAETGTRLTFFVTGCYDAWTDNADRLRPLVQTGQIQLGNHTWSHPDLSTLSDADVTTELQRNHDFLSDTYGVDARPYFRPPYGVHDDRVDALAAALGYTVPTTWYGSLADSGLLTEQQVVDFATTWFLPQHIVIGHLNFEPVTNVFPQLRALLHDRGLTTVTLNDVFTSAAHP